ncbi:uncharacterized protein [Linepithema humile]|uniref:uncharacterized protein isoform X2 n=1 Tax=Linepithema humile TaxID=83485 RepID=UPI00351F0B7F
MFYALCIFIVVVFGLSAAKEVPLPPITICKQNSVNYSDCLKVAIQKAWPQFVKGLPEFDFPPLDPFTFEFGNVVFDRDAIHGVVNISNFIGEGLSKTRFLAVRPYFDDEVFRLEVDLQTPKLTGSSEISVEGPYNITVEDLQATWIMKGHVANDTWTVENFYVGPSVKKFTLHFDIFKDNKEFNDLVVNFANEHWPSLYRIILPTAVEVWNPWLCDLANSFFSKVSFTKIFP